MKTAALTQHQAQFRARFADSDLEAQEPRVRVEQPAKVWLSAASAAERYDFPSVKAFRSFADRHGLIPAHMGRRAIYAVADIERVVERRHGWSVAAGGRRG